MPQSSIDVHNKQRPTVETVAKVVGHGYPMGSKEVHRTCHRRCPRYPHIDQWFDKSPGLPSRCARPDGEVGVPCVYSLWLRAGVLAKLVGMFRRKGNEAIPQKSPCACRLEC